MFPKIEIIHKPTSDFPKFTVLVDGEVIKVANSINPSELLEDLGIPHIYKMETKVSE